MAWRGTARLVAALVPVGGWLVVAGLPAAAGPTPVTAHAGASTVASAAEPIAALAGGSTIVQAGVPIAVVAAASTVVQAGVPIAARAAAGDTLRIDAPSFAAGRTATVAAVVSTVAGGDCRKVRWSLLLRVAGMRPDQVRVQRFEDTGDFPVRVRTDGNAIQLTDRQPDPGVLCRGRTVTARYRLAFAADVTDARVTLQVDALDGTLRSLARASVTRDVPGTVAAAPPSRPPSPVPTAVPTSAAPTAESVIEPPTDVPVVTAEAEPPAAGTGGGSGGTGRRDAADGLAGISAVQAAFLLGGLLLFLGVGLLLRMRHLISADRDGTGEPVMVGPDVSPRSRQRPREWSGGR